VLVVAVLAAAATQGLGCYYMSLASGQMRLMMARTSIEDVQADPEAPDELKTQLALVDRARGFAEELGLEVGDRYTSYVDWPGDRVVTTVVATRPGEVEARDFEFPIVGRVPYKGFFELEEAQAEAESLKAEGLDVCVIAVSAYSTLGWMDDPITAPMLRRDDDTRLVETVLHELVHATVFVESQPNFNEGVARFIGQEAAIRFFEEDPEQAEVAAARVRDDRAISAALLDFRNRVAALYALEAPAQQQRDQRDALEASFRAELQATPLESRDASAIGERVRLNDACLAIGGTYAEDTPLHEQLLAGLSGDLLGFVARLRAAADVDDPRAAFFTLPGQP